MSMYTNLLQDVLETGLQTAPPDDEDVKEFAIPPRMLLMLHAQLNENGFDLPPLWPGDSLTLSITGMGVVRLSACTVH